jgi:hypothetical protein
MSFLEPLFLLGLLGAALPLLVHLINRRKATKRSFPALKLLLESNKRVARSVKVRQWFLMALRVLAILLLALALAKPFFLSDAGVAAGERLPTAVVLVVDTSGSMTNAKWWDRARDQVSDELEKLRPWDEVALVTTTQREIPERLTDDHARIKDAARELSPEAHTGDLRQALQSAADVLATSQLPSRKIVLISDLAANNRAGIAPEMPYPIELEQVRRKKEEAPDNLSITGVQYEQDATEEATWRIEARVKNHSKEAREDIDIQLMFDGSPLSSGRIDRIGPGEEVIHVFRHRQATPGTFSAAVTLDEEDDYTLDDTFSFVFRTRSKIMVLIVNGEAASIAYDDESFFLTRALNPEQRSDSGLIPTTITPEGLANKNLSEYDVIILANVPRIPNAMSAKLERYVRDGGGLMVTSGDQIDIEAYNQTLVGLLPKPLRGLKELAKRDDPDAPVKITRFGASNHNHPIFRAFSTMGGSTLQSAQVYSYMLLEPGDPALSTTLLSYKDNAPALLERQLGRGRVLLLTTSIDFEWSDFPIRSAYLPMMQRTTQYLARRATSVGDSRYEVGGHVTLEVSGIIEERAIIKGPVDADEPDRFVLEPLDGQVVFTPPEPGVYQVWAGEDSNGEPPVEELTFAVNAAQSESDLTGMDIEAFEQWIAPKASESGSSGVITRGQTRERRVNIWPTLLFLVTLALLAETILGTRRSVLMRLWRMITGQRLEA